MRRRAVGVFGASGSTGRFVVAELLRRGFAPIAVARDSSKLAEAGFERRGVEARSSSIDDPASLDRGFAGCAAIVNCAGPFLDTADAVAGAAMRARAHYFDVTAEQASARATYEHFDAPAREAGVVVVPAMGFYGGFGDLMATAATGDWKFCDEIRIGIALNRWWPTEGTRNTGRRNTARRLVIADGELTPQAQPAGETSWNFPEPFGTQDMTEVPLSEAVVIARHLRVSNVRNYLNNASLRDLGDPNTPPPTAVDEAGRSAQTFLVEAIACSGSKTRRAVVRGKDIYAFTAPLVVEAVARVLDGEARTGGAFAPGGMFDAKDFLQALAPGHLTLEFANA